MLAAFDPMATQLNEGCSDGLHSTMLLGPDEILGFSILTKQVKSYNVVIIIIQLFYHYIGNHGTYRVLEVTARHHDFEKILTLAVHL